MRGRITIRGSFRLTLRLIAIVTGRWRSNGRDAANSRIKIERKRKIISLRRRERERLLDWGKAGVRLSGRVRLNDREALTVPLGIRKRSRHGKTSEWTLGKDLGANE